MDVSGSMMATDVSPTRLAAAQRAANDFVDQLPAGVKVGLVAFSTAPRVVVAATTDRAALHEGIADLRARGGTALGDAIITSLEAAGLDPAGTPGDPAATPPGDPSASDDPPAEPSAGPSASASGEPGAAEAPVIATVLLSDGANSTGEMEPLPAAEQAAVLGVPIYTIALGTADGVVTVPDDEGGCIPSTSRPTRRPWPRSPRRPGDAPSRRRPRPTSPRSTRASARGSATRPRSARSRSGSPLPACSSW